MNNTQNTNNLSEKIANFQSQENKLVANRRNINGKIVLGFTSLCLVLTGLSGFLYIQNQFSKLSNAALISGCAASETVMGDKCTITRPIQNNYAETCPTGTTKTDAVCAKFDVVTCASFNKGVDDGAGKCKFSDMNIYGGEIMTHDGRQCDGPGTSFYRYNVGFERNSTQGPIVCSNVYSLVQGKEAYRWVPKKFTGIETPLTTAGTNQYLACPTGYTELGADKCARSTVAKGCDQGGEYFDNNSCKPCPAGQYCPTPTSSTVTTSMVCGNGGTLTDIPSLGKKCVAPLKYSYTKYTDGCDAAQKYVKYDQTCAIEQVRERDLGCTYFYASENIYIKAATEADGKCSTGGRSDFDSTSIFKVSDLQCAGPGTAWYNYNVAYDPLICGNIYDANNKAAFRWLPTTFIKITGLQKIGTLDKTCPSGWTALDTASDSCYQDPITVETKTPIDCPINTYCPAGSKEPIACPAGSTSPAKSTKVEDCKAPVLAASSSSVFSSSVSSVSSSSSSSVSSSNSSATPTTTGGGVIIITNKSSSSSAVSSSVSSSSTVVNCPVGSYLNSAECVKCPEGKTTVSEGSKSIDACVAIVTVTNAATTTRTAGEATPAPQTARSGGFDNLGLVVLLATITTVSYLFYDNNYRKGGNREWQKIK